MIVRYTRRALNDLSRILDHLDERSPCRALSVKLAIRRAINAIGQNPGVGRASGREGTRAMPIGRDPYFIYRIVEENEARVVHIRHGARQPWRG
jgi:toxin ParE1/3/4